MPAVSQAQQGFMAICDKHPEKARKKCPPKKVARDYARTPRSGLPKRASSARVGHYMSGKSWER